MAPQMNELVPVPGPVAVSVVEGSMLNGGPRGHLALSLWALRHITAFPLDGISMQDITLPLVCILELFRPAESITATSGSEDAEGPASTLIHPYVTHDRRQNVTPGERRAKHIKSY